MLETLIEDVRHADVLLRLGDVQVIFGVLIDISPRSLFFCLIVSPLFQVFEINSPFLTHFYGSFSKTFGSRFIRMTQGPFNPLVGGSPHF